MEIFSKFVLEAARRLPNLREPHPCARLHGHSFNVEVHLQGPLDPVFGWVVDFAEVQKAWDKVHQQLDHRYLNEVPGLENPTSEHLAKWIWQVLQADLPTLSKIVVMETSTSGCVYCGVDQTASGQTVE
jgi:6-pyruvoyltetrahydropterin/6-carboxytetrahydropterin synthase